MGQKIDYNPDDWIVHDEQALSSIESNIILPDDFFSELMGRKSSKSNHDKKEAITVKKSDEDKTDSPKISAFLNGKKIKIGREGTDNNPLSAEEHAFKQQIEDLFELLELENSSEKTGVTRIYQTDSSPSKPWRFH
ncbi:MAG: hypothetical protein KAI02_04780 [Gammaproteobacteria bacterium]|nr:hypothetical protein [Gammaproteobacteria bacterium]